MSEVKAGLWKSIYMGLSERDETADLCKDSKGNVEADPVLRDTESIPLKENIQKYFEREVIVHVPDAWIDESKTKIGYEIPFTKHFYQYTSLRSTQDILRDIQELEAGILDKLKKVLG